MVTTLYIFPNPFMLLVLCAFFPTLTFVKTFWTNRAYTFFSFYIILAEAPGVARGKKNFEEKKIKKK